MVKGLNSPTSIAPTSPKELWLMYVCACLYSGVLLYYCMSWSHAVMLRIELGVVKGWFEPVGKHAVMCQLWCGCLYLLKVVC